MPLKWEPGQVRYPDLAKIDEASWPKALAPLPRELRVKAARNQHLGARWFKALGVADALPPSQTDRARKAVREGTTFPTPRVARPGRRQVTVRITDAEYEDLTVAATLLGARPAQLARMLVLNGTRRALADQDAAGAG